MFITGYCSFLAQLCTVLPQSCGFSEECPHTQCGVYGLCQLWDDHLGAKQVAHYKGRNQGGCWGAVAIPGSFLY